MSMRILWKSSHFFSRIRTRCFNDTIHKQATWNGIMKSFKQSNKYNNESHQLKLSLVASASSLAAFGLLNTEEKDTEKDAELIMTIKRSILLIQKGEHKKAEQMLHVALRQAQILQNNDGVTYVYDLMANLAFEMGENEKAKELFKSVMQRLLGSGVEQNDKKIIHMSLKMAKILERIGEYTTAEDGYKFCLQHAEEHVKKTPDNEDAVILYGMSLDWYANMLLANGRYNEALDNYLQAYQWCVEAYGKNHEQTVVLLNDLGTVCCLLDQNDRALGYLSDAIEIGRDISDTSHLSAVYVNLGKVYLKKGMCDAAKKACSEGLKLGKKSDDEECQEQANNCLVEVKKLLSK